MKIEMIAIEKLVPYARNARKHSDTQISQIAASIREFSFTQPLLIKDDMTIVSGNGRFAAAQKLELKEVPCIRLSNLTETQAKAYGIVDNQLALNSTWDDDLLKLELEDLKLDEFDLDLLGFDLDDLKLNSDLDKDEKEDEIPEPPKEIWVKSGDMFQLGSHRLLCGDCLIKQNVDRLMDGQKADMVFTSPPYNCGIKYSKYDDKKEKEDYIKFIGLVIKNCFDFMKNGRSIFWNCGSSPKSHAHAHALEIIGFTLKRQIIWKKIGCPIPLWQNTVKNPVARNYLPNYTHENIFFASKGDLELGKKTSHDDKLSNDVWEISQFSAGGHDHPAAFPVELVELPLLSMTNESEILFEPFCGSGSTLIACEKTGRKCYGMEIDPQYVQVILERWKTYTGNEFIKL